MLDDSLTLITPTAGRASLERTLNSYLPQMGPRDEYLIMGDTTDGPLPQTEAIVARFDERFRYIPVVSTEHTWGHAEFNAGLDLARNAWVLGNDDDDIGTPDALPAIREAISQLAAPAPMLFRFRTHYGMTFWDRPGVVQSGHIGGHSAVFPNLPDLVGRYAARYEGDLDFIVDTLARWPNGVADAVWVNHLIAIARPGDYHCTVCGQPATTTAVDTLEVEAPDGSPQHARVAPIKYGCAQHPAVSRHLGKAEARS